MQIAIAQRRTDMDSITRFLFLFAIFSFAAAQTPSPTPSASANIYPGTAKWTYHGCYNETTGINGTAGLRALSGGTTDASDRMSVPVCLDLCEGGNFAFAGLEYRRECYCSNYLSALSTKVDDKTCSLSCQGNDTQICGGSLALSVYQAKSSKESASTKGVRERPVGSILALGIAIGVLLCLA
ncbi:hypothetical protein HYFRA_00011882 [Hymenoscyphus fraxineus]|uniref:WSC domain-containing protein n=1 Tax=Hymenoscyphus fraxineus TaxID=746836 RepID=A0A9N9L0U6_9HELO|nr:hypothetical protein HYFRA_00011882 [Hymenoscyphus fraxineus]